MDIKKIQLYTIQPKLYSKGTALMWADAYISQQLLQVHLDPEVDLASRKKATIERTANWILSQNENQNLNILDLGCGPGLYTQLFAQKGHKVTGIDISENSIGYAKKQAEAKHLDINYINANYLNLELEENQFDLVVMIYTDLGVLLPAERDKLIGLIYRVLKKGGTFIFDLLNDEDLEHKMSPKSYEVESGGFWNKNSHIVLSDSFLYKKEKVILYQHVVIDETEEVAVYRFWTHFFSYADITAMLKKQPFGTPVFYNEVLPKSGEWNASDVTFCKVIKE